MGLREIFFPPKRDFVKMLKEQAEKTAEGMQALQGIGVTGDAANAVVARLLDTQSVMIATNDMMLYVAMTFLAAAVAIWLAPKPKR